MDTAARTDQAARSTQPRRARTTATVEPAMATSLVSFASMKRKHIVRWSRKPRPTHSVPTGEPASCPQTTVVRNGTATARPSSRDRCVISIFGIYFYFSRSTGERFTFVCARTSWLLFRFVLSCLDPVEVLCIGTNTHNSSNEHTFIVPNKLQHNGTNRNDNSCSTANS